MTRKLILVAAATVALLGCGGGPNDDTAPNPAHKSSTPSAEPVLAATGDAAEGTKLRWVDGRTLEPIDGRSVSVPFAPGFAELSPDGSSLAVAENEGGGVQLVDLDRMHALGTVDLGAAVFVERLHWVRPDLLLASLGGLSSRAASLNPEKRQVLSVQDLGGTVLYSQPTQEGLVFLVAPSSGIGQAQLVVFDGGELRTAELTEVRAGWEQVEGSEEDYEARQSVPALAVDPSGARAVVIPAGDRVAEVDLATMQVSYHDLNEPISLLGRLRDWLEPAAQAKGTDGPDRNAVWLPSGLIAVSGSHYSMDGESFEMTPAGLALIDPADWSIRRLSDEPNWVTFRGGALLASAWKEGTEEQKLIAFDPDGTPRFTLVREAADLSQTSGTHLYATTYNGTRFEIVDLETGETVGKAAPKRETWLLYLDD
jgi:hypothetical protein